MRKTLIISDMHSASLIPAIEIAREEKAERILCLGDFDHPGRARELLDCRINFMFALGNHDYWFVNEDINTLITSPHFKEPFSLWYLWGSKGYKREIKFVRDAREINSGVKYGLEVMLEVSGRKCLAAHSYPGEISPDNHDRINTRVVNREQCQPIFNWLERKNYWILFRGHDHGTMVFERKGKETKLDYRFDEISLDDSARYVINPGAYVFGKVGILEEEEKVTRLRIETLEGEEFERNIRAVARKI